MNTPQIVWICLAVVGITISLVKHAEPRDNYNFWTTAISVGIEVCILYWGGFFS